MSVTMSKPVRDPTYREMYDYLAGNCGGEEDIRFDIEEAIYWFASDYHGGQWSNLYEALCQSEYAPGPLASKPEHPLIYDMLVQEYT